MLSECDRLGYGSTKPGLFKVFISPFVEGWDGADEKDRSAMQRKYEVFETLIHEYLHVLEHPLIPQATGNSLTVREGVCEWLTCQVINALAAGGDDDLRDIVSTVEGAKILDNVPGRVPALRQFLAQYKPKADYVRYVTAVEKVAGLCGENGMKAAFFQGHVEFFGLWEFGDWRSGIKKMEDGTRYIPNVATERLNSVEAFSKATGLPREKILQYNPELNQAIDKWPEQLYLPGYHVHRTIVVGTDLVETWQQIAAQHNVTEQRIKPANLMPDDGEVPIGSWLLVPDREG